LIVDWIKDSLHTKFNQNDFEYFESDAFLYKIFSFSHQAFAIL